ncbi:hypothetical protein GCM10011351_29400 [Paraliobacillus quinghaiensis]|uniref:Uncharacterized protein n=1 Tax=Paraliobacillus quinghaiensis TaxID=470815 RepID=A0A917TWX7_9BACI|nr:hypothetical protein [Paraliobacillus quinghaiensis]GGM41346.1 hypothetical protein GCM10011351_29400 [Paraliobacillus quinghaiensis]
MGGITVNKKILFVFLAGALVFTGIYAAIVNGQRADLERKITISKMRLTNAMSYNSLFYLFDKVIENQSKENREALNSALRNKESQMRTYLALSLSEEQLNEKFSTENGKTGLLDYRLSNAKLLNMDNNNKPVDIEVLQEMKTAWQVFKQDTGGSPEFMDAKGPFIIADAYKKLVNKMENTYSKLE